MRLRYIPTLWKSAATDASYYAHLDLPTVIYAPTGTGAHAPDERVSVQSLHDYADMLTAYLKAECSAAR